ncbi:hypothetical protein BD560DRAFT_404215 [Blakeslea trispora]|nr:hypothetical protein BD560DRAFT_404215 [Blakeslea trispora]
MPVYESSLLNIPLPSPKVVPGSYLLGLYTCMLGTDYFLLRHQLPIGKRIIRISIVAAHAVVPLVIISPFQPNNVAFAALPWFLASYSAYLPSEHLTMKQWIKALSQTVIDSSRPAKPSEGFWKLVRGVTKLVALTVLVDQWLPSKPQEIFQYPYFSTTSFINTFLFGVKAYLILGASDILAGVVEIVSGKRIIDVFDAPYLATRYVIFHHALFLFWYL